MRVRIPWLQAEEELREFLEMGVRETAAEDALRRSSQREAAEAEAVCG